MRNDIASKDLFWLILIKTNSKILKNSYLLREITSSVLFGDVMVRNGIFWTIGEQYYIGYYPIKSYRKIKVYRF